MVKTEHKSSNNWIDQNEISEYLADVRKYKPLTKDEEIKLINKIKNGCDKSKEELIYANLRYVITVAKGYQNRGIPIADLISEGNLGLIIAAEKFNYNQTKVRFLSYAIWWVKQQMLNCINVNSRTIRIPINVITELNKVRQNYFKNPETAEDPMKTMGLPLADIYYYDSNDDGESIFNCIEDKNSTTLDDILKSDDNLLSKKIQEILLDLTEVERYVIVKSIGLDGEELSLQQIGENLGLTKVRVRHIKLSAIKKLRADAIRLFELL
jgi:RNA polymerase primary sigma factor